MSVPGRRLILLGAAAEEAERRRRVANKEYVRAWIGYTVKGDAALGRTNASFLEDPQKALAPHAARLNAKDIYLFTGSGNIFVADAKPLQPVVIHRRPLAQRHVRLTPAGTS